MHRQIIHSLEDIVTLRLVADESQLRSRAFGGAEWSDYKARQLGGSIREKIEVETAIIVIFW